MHVFVFHDEGVKTLVTSKIHTNHLSLEKHATIDLDLDKFKNFEILFVSSVNLAIFVNLAK
jgi:hypothetical protein